MASEGLLLVHNGLLYCSGVADYNWMLVNAETGYIEKVGRGGMPDSLASDSFVRRVDCEGRRVLPGLIDSHLHVLQCGIVMEGVQLRGCDSINEFNRRLRDHVQRNTHKPKYYGRGWDQTLLGRYPTADDIDAVCADKPVVLSHERGSIAVVNSKVLQLLGITKEWADPPGCQIDRYPGDHPKAGEPTGVLIEPLLREPPVSLVSQWYGPVSRQEKLDCITTGLDACLHKGVTTVHALDESCWPLYCDLVDEGRLPLRTFFVDNFIKRDQTELPRPGSTHGSLLSTDRVKLFVDGFLGDSTATLSQPYIGTDQTGVFVHTQGELNRLVAQATGLGYRLELHTIGDAAIDATLAALDVARVSPEKRPILVHCQIVRPDQMEKLKERGVIASIQPQFVPTDANWANKCLPKQLLQSSYPWKSLLHTGVHCALSSDAPCEKPDPFIGIYEAVFRKRGNSPDSQEFRPEEKLTVEEAIDLYTKGGAYTAMREHCLGQLLPGFLADFVIVDAPGDVVREPAYFLDALPAQVWVAGQRKL